MYLCHARGSTSNLPCGSNQMEGKIDMHPISIMIGPISTHSYLTPRIAKNCGLKKVNHDKAWMVQFAIGAKRKVSEVVKGCLL